MYNGIPGEAYNVANEDTYCSIYEMATLVAHRFGENINVVVEINENNNNGYAPTLHMNLDTQKLRKLGWTPQVELSDMFSSMIEDMKNNKL